MIDTLVCEKKDSLSAVALLDDGVLSEIEFCDSNKVSEGSVYLGKVTHKLDLANGKVGFLIDIGDTKDAFINLEENDLDEEKITEGQSLVVQVFTEKREEKGAKVIRSVKIAGENIIYCPYMMGIQVSSKIRDHASVGEYKQVVSDNTTSQEGWILRTSIIDVDFEDLINEMNELRATYEEVRKKARSQKAPSLLYSIGNPLIKYIGTYKDSLRKIIVNSHNVENELKESFGDSFDITYQREPFDDLGLDEAINDALSKEVRLKGGGRVTIEETKACVAIDVDSGDSTSIGSVSRLNTEAAVEIVRQIRLRNLSGKIIIDFAGSSEYKYLKPVLDVLKEELDKDANNKAYLVGLSRGGNVEIIRTRRRPSLQELLTVGCETCEGTGRVFR